jgi:hypothetical protein
MRGHQWVMRLKVSSSRFDLLARRERGRFHMKTLGLVDIEPASCNHYSAHTDFMMSTITQLSGVFAPCLPLYVRNVQDVWAAHPLSLMPLRVQRTTIEGERMTELVLGTISPLEATNTDSSLQGIKRLLDILSLIDTLTHISESCDGIVLAALVCKGALDLLEDYAVRYQAVGTKEEGRCQIKSCLVNSLSLSRPIGRFPLAHCPGSAPTSVLFCSICPHVV